MQITMMGTIRAGENDMPILTLDGELANGAHRFCVMVLTMVTKILVQIIPLVMHKKRYICMKNGLFSAPKSRLLTELYYFTTIKKNRRFFVK